MAKRVLPVPSIISMSGITLNPLLPIQTTMAIQTLLFGHQTGIGYFKNLGSPSSPLFAEQTGSQNPFGNINIQGARSPFADLKTAI